MLERLKNNIEVNHPKNATEQERNDNRQQAIHETFSREYTLNQDDFMNRVKDDNLHNGKGGTLQELRHLDFKQANPHNSIFLDELKSFGKDFMRAFVEEFGIQLNKEKEAYQKDFQIVEQQDDEQTKSRYYIGTFEDKEMERLTPFKEDKNELQAVLDKHQVQEREQEKSASIDNGQELELRKED